MLGEIITTFAGAGLVIGVGLAGETIHRTLPSPSAQGPQGLTGAQGPTKIAPALRTRSLTAAASATWISRCSAA